MNMEIATNFQSMNFMVTDSDSKDLPMTAHLNATPSLHPL